MLICSAVSWAAPPVLINVAPLGAERGRAVEVLVQGANLTAATTLVVPFKAQVKPLPAAKPAPNQLRFQVTVDPTTPAGIYPVRLFNEAGVSNLGWFGVDPFPNVLEVEDNNSFDKPQKAPFPCVISGQCAGGDVDYYRVEVNKGQRVVVETEAARIGSGVVPQIRVTDAKGRFIAADDTQRFKGDCRVWFVAPTEGGYVVEFSDTRYRGGNPPEYRLKIGDYDAPEEIFPLGGKRGDATAFTMHGGNLTSAIKIQRTLMPPSPLLGLLHPDLLPLDLQSSLKAGWAAPNVVLGNYPEVLHQANAKEARGQAVAPPVTINGRFDKRDDIQRWQFPVKENQRWRFKVEAEALGSYLDGVLKLTDQAGKQLATADEIDVPPTAPGQLGTKSADPLLEFTVPKGVTSLGIELRDAHDRGGVNFGYRLTIERSDPDFVVQQPAGEINVPRGGFTVVNVPVTRRGFNGPIQLGLSSLPAGWAVQGGYVPEGSTIGQFTLKHVNPGLGMTSPLFWRLEGQGEKGPTRHAELGLVLSKEGNVAASMVRYGYVAVGLSEADPFVVQGPPTVELVPGYPVPAPITIAWPMKPLANVEVTGLVANNQGKPDPKAAAVKPGTATMDKNQTTLTLTAPINTGEGRSFDVVPQGKAKVNNKDVTVIGSAITVLVKKPFTVDLTAMPMLKPGQTFTWKGKIQRHPLFKEAVQLKVDGLPATVALVPATLAVPANKSEFQFDFKVDAKAPQLMAKLAVTATATINGMAYSHAPLSVELTLVKK